MILKIHPDNPPQRKIAQVTEALQQNGLIIYPTDTVYALACAIDQKKAFERLCRIKGVQTSKAVFSVVFLDMSQASDYLLQFSTPVYRILKRNLPGPFTFILNAGGNVPSHVRKGRKTIGIRIIDHNVTRAILEDLQKPLITASLKKEDEIIEYYSNPIEIHEQYQHSVDIVIDSGSGQFQPSTVVDLSEGTPVILREGKGQLVT